MRARRPDPRPLAVAFVAVVLGSPLAAQERSVIGKEVSVGGSGATLRLELDDGRRLEVAFDAGSVAIDGAPAGTYRTGGALDVAFRGLLARAVELDGADLARELEAWSPPEGLDGEALDLARRIDRTLAEAARARSAASSAGPPAAGGGDFQVHVGDDVVIEAGSAVPGDLVVVGGTATIEGVVRGDVTAIEGNVRLATGGEVGGDVRLVDSGFENEGGLLAGRVLDAAPPAPAGLGVTAPPAPDTDELRDRLREQLRDELGGSLRDEIGSELRRSGRRGSGGLLAPLRSVLSAVGGLVENLVTVFFLGLLGVGASTFAGTNLDTVAEQARRDPRRSAVVGVAGAFLLLPVWVVGAVVLAVSIIGIPALIAWVPLFPLAAVAAVLFGFLSVARNTGEWLAGSGYPYAERLRASNPVHTIFGGVLALLSAFIVANVLHLVPFAGFFRGLLVFAGFAGIAAAAAIGFGAVLLTRAGRERPYGALDPEEVWAGVGDAEPASARSPGEPGPKAGRGDA